MKKPRGFKVKIFGMEIVKHPKNKRPKWFKFASDPGQAFTKRIRL